MIRANDNNAKPSDKHRGFRRLRDEVTAGIKPGGKVDFEYKAEEGRLILYMDE